ncbi:MAG: M42 family metallopeptidase [Oscillospiraceae bacterium]|jgi:putative aminopeptidase FrvX
MNLTEMIKALCSLAAPSGFEDQARKLVRELLEPYVDEMREDPMGNLIAVKKCGKPDAKRLMLDAHMDEVGLIVTGIEKGFLRFATLGGIDPRMLPAREVRSLTEEPVVGVIDTMPPHALAPEEMDKAIETDNLFIDVGMSQEQAAARIPLGTAAVFAGGCETLGSSMLCGKALDDRACVAIIIKTMENLKDRDLNLDLYCLISTQEEVGTRGAITGTYSIRPDYAIAVDVTHAHTPDAKKEKTLPMGKGAAIGVGPNMNRFVTELLIETAKDKSIPYQVEVLPSSSGTDGWVIQISRSGVPTGLVSLPVKYMHSPVEMMNVDDAEAIVRLLTEFTLRLGEERSYA